MTRPGRPPKDPYEIVDYREVQTDGGVVRRPVRAIDRIEEAIRANGFLHDAAGRAGVTAVTLRQWRDKGVRANIDILNGRRRRSDLTLHERRCVDLSEVMQRAESDARLSLTGVISKAARGDIEVTKTIVRQDAAGNELGRQTETTRTLPDARAAQWILAHRYPADFAGRVEVTGAGGGPIAVDVSPKERLLAAAERAAARLAGTAELASNGARAGNGAESGPAEPGSP